MRSIHQEPTHEEQYYNIGFLHAIGRAIAVQGEAKQCGLYM